MCIRCKRTCLCCVVRKKIIFGCLFDLNCARLQQCAQTERVCQTRTLIYRILSFSCTVTSFLLLDSSLKTDRIHVISVLSPHSCTISSQLCDDDRRTHTHATDKRESFALPSALVFLCLGHPSRQARLVVRLNPWSHSLRTSRARACRRQSAAALTRTIGTWRNWDDSLAPRGRGRGPGGS